MTTKLRTCSLTVAPPVRSFTVFAVQDDRSRARLLLLEYLDRIPCFIRRLLLVFERAIEIHLGQKIVGIEFEKSRQENSSLLEIASSKMVDAFFVGFEPL